MGQKISSLNCLIVLCVCTMGTIEKFKKSQTPMLHKPGKPKSEITLAILPTQFDKLSG